MALGRRYEKHTNMKRIIFTFILALMLFATLAYGDEYPRKNGYIYELKFGVLNHDVDGLWSGLSSENGIDFNLEAILEPSLTFFGGALRPALGISLNDSGNTSKIYCDARWQYDFKIRLFMTLGVGATLQNGATDTNATNMKALGSPLLFHIPLEFGYYFIQHYSISVYFDHISNAYLNDHNEGLDTLGLRLGYRF